MAGEPETAKTDGSRGPPPVWNRVLLAAYVVFLCTTPFGEIRLAPDSAWFTPTKVGFLLLAATAAAAFLAGCRPRLPVCGTALLAAFLGAAFLAAVFSSCPPKSLVYALRLAALAALCSCTVWIAAPPASPRPILLTLIGISVAMSLLGAYQTLTGKTIGALGEYADLGRMQEIFRPTANGGVMVVRAAGAFDHPNLFACFLIASLPYALVLVSRAPVRRFSFLASAAAVFVCVMALVFTFSRSSFLGFAAALVVLAVTRLVNAKSLAVVFLAATVAVCLLPGPARLLLWKRETAVQGADGGRLFSFRIAGRMIREHPFRGVGPGLFDRDANRYRRSGEAYPFNPRHKMDAHNTYLDLAAEAGLPALALFLGIVAGAGMGLREIVVRTGRSPPAAGDATTDAAMAVGAALAALLAQSLLHSLEYQEVFWVLIGLGVAFASRAARNPGVADRRADGFDNNKVAMP